MLILVMPRDLETWTECSFGRMLVCGSDWVLGADAGVLPPAGEDGREDGRATTGAMAAAVAVRIKATERFKLM